MYQARSEDFYKRMLAEFDNDPELKGALDSGGNLHKWFKPYISIARTPEKATIEVLVAMQMIHMKDPNLPVGEALRQFIVRRGLFEEDRGNIKLVA